MKFLLFLCFSSHFLLLLFCRAAGWLLHSWTFTKRYWTTTTTTTKERWQRRSSSSRIQRRRGRRWERQRLRRYHKIQPASPFDIHKHGQINSKRNSNWERGREIWLQYSMANTRITENYFLMLSNKPSVFLGFGSARCYKFELSLLSLHISFASLVVAVVLFVCVILA